LAQTKRVQTDLRLKSYFHPALRWGVVWKKIPWMMSPEWWHESIPNVPKLL
jgi:hypothetical protein